MKWMKAEGAVIDKDGNYLVKTNGAEWNDGDLKLLPGFVVKKLLEPNVVRGRAVWVARITDPEGFGGNL